MILNKKVLTGLSFPLFLASCATSPQYPQGGRLVDSFASGNSCESTKLRIDFINAPNDYWKEKLKSSVEVVNNVLATDEFARQCQSTKMNRTNGKSVQEVCKEIACSGERIVKYDFYHDPNTRAIAFEANGITNINTAKKGTGAGEPGNVAHEFTHTLGYTHFTNWSFLGRYSVPYKVGDIVQRLAEQ